MVFEYDPTRVIGGRRNQGRRAFNDPPPRSTFESTAWWPIPGSWNGCELGDAMEIRRPSPWYEGEYDKVPITFAPDGRPRAVIGCESVALSRIVASVIYGQCPHGQLVRHLDDDVSNSYPSNLAYGTQADNIADSLRNGTFPVGERNGRARLDADAVRRIRREGGSPAAWARLYGVDRRTIVNVIERKTWRHIA